MRIEDLHSPLPGLDLLDCFLSGDPDGYGVAQLRAAPNDDEDVPFRVNDPKLASGNICSRLALRENQSRQDQARRRASEETKQDRNNQQTNVNGLSHRSLRSYERKWTASGYNKLSGRRGRGARSWPCIRQGYFLSW